MRAALPFILAASACAPLVPARAAGNLVSVELRADDGRVLPLYPASGVNRAYAEAEPGAGYRIVVRNRTGQRLGLCIAVDGRNIISGARSDLAPGERLYLLEPYAVQEYSGWRSGRDRINRFFFTRADDSYAAAFGDTTAMGVVAVAAFREVRPRPCPGATLDILPDCAPAAPAPGVTGSAPGTAAGSRLEARKSLREEAGTGYGREEWSPSVTVPFRPEAQAWEKTFIKYEWHDTLVRMGVLPTRPRNRFWEEGYAPPPPRG